jgi:hypothetical protein
MISFEPPPEPDDFDEEVRQPGTDWLSSHSASDGRPPSYWNDFKTDLADGFGELCGYSAMYTPNGTVDHYLSWSNHPELAYEWSNYRYAAGWMNSSKQDADDKVLDPFEVEDGWFEIILPSLQLVVSDDIPAEHREKAEFTLERLNLRDDERVIRQRRSWYEMFEEDRITLEGLREVAPLIARAVEESS